MITYFIYNFILFGSVYFAYLYEKSNSKVNQRVYLSFSFIIPFVFLALRYDIGTDYKDYVNYFNNIANNGNVNAEFGYYWLNYGASYLGFGEHTQFVVIGFFTLFLLYKVFPKEDFAIAIFLLITIFYLYYGYGAIRQGLAVAIMACALPFLHQRKFLEYFLLCILASWFHLATALLLLFMYFFANVKVNKYLMLFSLGFLFVINAYVDIISPLFSFVQQLIPKYKDMYVIGISIHTQKIIGSFGLLAPLIKILPVFVVIFFKDKIAEKFDYGNIVINMTFLYGASTLFALQIHIFSRVSGIFVIYFILSMVYFIKIFDAKQRILPLLLICFLYFSWFERYITIATLDQHNGQYVRPYQTILFDRL